MKTNCMSLVVAALLSIPLAGLAQIPGSVSNAVFSLTFTYTAPGTVLKDSETGKPLKGEEAGPTYSNEWHISNEAKGTEENTYEYVSKTLTQKFGNKELLLALIEAGVLPEYGKEPFIAGWSIVLVNGSFTDEGGYTHDGDSKFYAVHKTENDIVDLSAIIQPSGGSELSGYAEKGAYKDVFKSSNSDPENPQHTITSAFSWKESTMVVIDFEGVLGEFNEETFFAALQGIFTQSDKLTSVGADKVPVIVNGAGKLASISGTGPYIGDESFDRSVAEGSISFSAGKATEDVSMYPDLPLGEEF